MGRIKAHKPIRFYASKDFRIQEDKWTRKPEDLMYWCDQGDTEWKLVSEKIRQEACGKQRNESKNGTTEMHFEESAGESTGGNEGVPRRSVSRFRRDPGDPAPR